MKFRSEFRAMTVRSVPAKVIALIWVAILAALTSDKEIARAADKDDPVPLALDFRKLIPKVVADPKALEAREEAIPQTTDEELKDDEARGEQLHRDIMAKLRRVQRNSHLVTVLGGEPIFRLPHFTLTMASLGQERTEKMQNLQRRESEAMNKTFPGHTPEHPVDYSRWANHPNAKPFQEERERIKAWFKQSLEEERRKYKEGDSEASQTLERLRQETLDEMSLISSFRRAVRNEWHKRRHEPIEEDWQITEAREKIRKGKERKEAAETAKQHRQMNVHVVAVRTEYEVRPNEAAVVMFQVFKGRPPYLLDLKAPNAGQGRLWLNQSTPGEFQFPLMYAKAGIYPATLTVMDADWGSASASVTITVKGEPIPIPKDEEEPARSVKKAASPPPIPPPVGNVPVPIVGTFNALFWSANAGLIRWDEFGQPSGIITPVPLKITLDPSGALRGAANYELPASEMMKPKDPAWYGIYWRSRFDVEGKIDWKTGVTHIDIKNGHDEAGYEKNADKLHWQMFHLKNYSTQLIGWTLPGPEADKWLGKTASIPGMTERLKTSDLEKGGLPGVLIGANGKLSFRDRGFFGTADYPPKPGGVAHRRLRYSSCLFRYGPDDQPAIKVIENAKGEQEQEDKNVQRGEGNWYLKVLGPASPGADPGSVDPKSDIQAFGLWPTRPVRLKVGGAGKARAIAVYRQNVYKAVDISAKVTWTSNGLQMLGNGAFRAMKPGTFTITARTTGGPQAMSSTLQVIVDP